MPDHPLPALAYKPDSVRRAEPLFAEVRRQQEELARTLPSNYELLCQLHGR